MSHPGMGLRMPQYMPTLTREVEGLNIGGGGTREKERKTAGKEEREVADGRGGGEVKGEKRAVKRMVSPE